MSTEKKAWVSTVQKLAMLAIEAFVQFKVVSRWAELKTLIFKEGSEIKKKLPLMGILFALLFSGIMTTWLTLFVVGVMTLHIYISSVIECLGIMLFINVFAVLMTVVCVVNVFKKAVKPLTKK